MAFVVSSCQKDETTTTIVDFEDVTLTSGISASTSFTSGNCKFSGNPVEFWNGGVLCSSKNDTVTTGYLNQFSTRAGSGALKSKQFGIVYAPGSFTGPADKEGSYSIESIMVTNSTYAYFDMKNGNAPIRLVGSAIVVDDAGRSLAGYEPNYIPQPVSIPRGNDSGDLYRILYENSKEEARDYKRKYEDALNEKHKVELELAGNKNSFVGDIAQGLAGFAPMLMGGMGGGVGVGSVAPSAPQPLKPVTDTKLAAIIQYYNRLDAHDKDKVYNLLALVFGLKDGSGAVHLYRVLL